MKLTPSLPWLLSAMFFTFSQAGAATPTAREVAVAESEWVKAQQDYYEALKREKSPTVARKRELDLQILEPKREALKKIQSRMQSAQKNPSTALPSPTASMPPSMEPPANDPASETNPETVLPPIEFGRSPPPQPSQPPMKKQKFSIDDVPNPSSSN